MKKMHISLILFILFGFVFNNIALSWDDKVTHKDLSKFAAENSVLDKNKGDYLKNLGFEKGLEEYLKWNEDKKIKDWIREGAEFEDKSDPLFPVFGTTRSVNHFHNPLKPWSQAGLDDWFISHYVGESSLLWAQDGAKQQTYVEGDWSWQKIREYYYLALTSKTETDREANFAKTFRGLGHQMHLIQDAAQPDHVRNDAHPEDAIFGKNILNGGRYFETWAKEEWRLINSFAASPIFPAISFNVSYNGFVPITLLFDTDQYNGTNPTTSLTQGISEYTNANFFSGDTIFAAERYASDHRHYFPYPKRSSTDLQSFIAGTKPPETFVDEDGNTYTGIWVSKASDGEAVNHLVRTSSLTRIVYTLFGEGDLFYSTFYRDEKCHEDYAQKLIPRAVGYSAGLLDYFFRGELQVTAVPIVHRNVIQYLRVKVRNITPTQEMMKGGHFVLTYRYTPTGKKPDGSEDFFGLAWANYPVQPEANNSELKYAVGQDNPDEMVIDFLLPDPIPWENYQSAKFTLAFRGDLGKYEGQTFVTYEKDAVIGKSLTLGEVKFNEEWDNGLTGNYTWAHTGFNLLGQNPDNGSTSNIIEAESLVKDNIRYAGNETARVNESFLSIYYNNGQFKGNLPIKITPNTHIVFKIDEMWINERTPASPGYTNDWQYLWLGFSNGLGIQYSVQGQGVDMGSTVAYFEFDPNLVVVDNIYDLFKIWEITIPPGDLYLNEISLVQQLFFLDDPSTVQHHQHMRIDGIWIIEGKQQ